MSAHAEADKGEVKKKKPIVLIIGIVVLVAALVFGKGFLGGAKAEGKKKKKHKAEVGITLPLDEFIVNLEGGGDHYLRTTVALGMLKGLTEEKAKEEVAPMRDAILTVLSSKTVKELSSSKGREALKKEIKREVNDALASGSGHGEEDEEEEEDKVLKVYFTAFATQ